MNTKEMIKAFQCEGAVGEVWIKGFEAEIRASIKQEIYQLDWIKILNEAIKSRPSSWNDNPVREWRNASDEILGALIHQMEDKKLIPTFKDLTEPYMHKLKEVNQ